ncbi:MAG: DUF2155 domain-containing protein [Alphaproteobacteria bacterium]|nr:DUF2155 domain-containing protein [Alphaproteobacteria bacterium]
MKIKFIIFILALVLSPVYYAHGASGIAKNNAKMQAMDKITGRVSVINVPVNSMVEFGSLSIVVRSCKTRPAEETPDNFAFVDITDKNLKGDEFNIFKGWMISSSPATHAVEHPIYDVWLLQCTDEKDDKKNTLSKEDLAKRDSLPMINDDTRENDNLGANGAKGDSLELTQTISEMKDDKSQIREDEEIPQTETEFFYDEEGSEEEFDEEIVEEKTNE